MGWNKEKGGDLSDRHLIIYRYKYACFSRIGYLLMNTFLPFWIYIP